MPYRDPEIARQKRKEAYERRKAADPEYQKRLYQKHRAKRLAAKKAEYDADPEKMRARNRANYAKHAKKRAAAQKAYRAANREKVNAEARESYHRNKAKHRMRRKAYYERNYEKLYALIQRWRKQNPERELLYHAKRLLNEQVGIPIRDIPDELAEAKAEQIKLHRMVKEQL